MKLLNSGHSDFLPAQSDALTRFIEEHAPLLVITGAGVSTSSGIPAYRDRLGNWKHRPPVQHKDFMSSAATRQRYWARSLAGWPILRQAQPNAGHFRTTELEKKGYLTSIVTQNVDRLHQKAGSQQVIDLHGRADELLCTSCGYREPRDRMHELCAFHNPSFNCSNADAAPDGDARIEMDCSNFDVPGCPECDGILKTDVVFFGDNVPRNRVDQVFNDLDRSQGVLVLGSSLMVYSGFRFARYAHQNNKPLAIITQGVSRADNLATLKIDANITPLLDSIQVF